MATYVFCQRPSDSARELCDALDAFRIRRFDGLNFWRKARRVNLKAGDIVICWGEEFPVDEAGVRVLNGNDVGDKLQQAYTLRNYDVPTIQTTERFPNDGSSRNRIAAGWVGRKKNHVGGN